VIKLLVNVVCDSSPPKFPGALPTLILIPACFYPGTRQRAAASRQYFNAFHRKSQLASQQSFNGITIGLENCLLVHTSSLPSCLPATWQCLAILSLSSLSTLVYQPKSPALIVRLHRGGAPGCWWAWPSKIACPSCAHN
jgi:hypothetical protein